MQLILHKWLSTDTQSASFIVSSLAYIEKIIIKDSLNKDTIKLTEHCDIIYEFYPQVG